MTDALERVLRLVAEGRLSAEEAEPILAALAERESGAAAPAPGTAASTDAAGRDASRRGRVARIQVHEAGRNAVDVRIPLSLGRFGLSSIPGLSGDIADRLREAVDRGEVGPVLEVQDDDGAGVRIVIE